MNILKSFRKGSRIGAVLGLIYGVVGFYLIDVSLPLPIAIILFPFAMGTYGILFGVCEYGICSVLPEFIIHVVGWTVIGYIAGFLLSFDANLPEEPSKKRYKRLK